MNDSKDMAYWRSMRTKLSFLVPRGWATAMRSPFTLGKRLATLRGALCLSFMGLATLECSAQNAYLQQNLVSDLAGVADHTDTNLVNPWGIAFGATPFWICDNRTGRVTVHDGSGTGQTVIVEVPPRIGGTPSSAPSGIVFAKMVSFIFHAHPKPRGGSGVLRLVLVVSKLAVGAFAGLFLSSASLYSTFTSLCSTVSRPKSPRTARIPDSAGIQRLEAGIPDLAAN